MPCFRRPLEVEMSFLALITSPFSQSQQTPPPLQRNADSSPPAQPCGQLCRDEFGVSPQKQSHLARSASGKISSRLFVPTHLVNTLSRNRKISRHRRIWHKVCLWICHIFVSLQCLTTYFKYHCHVTFKISQDYQQLLVISNNLPFKYFICFN